MQSHLYARNSMIISQRTFNSSRELEQLIRYQRSNLEIHLRDCNISVDGLVDCSGHDLVLTRCNVHIPLSLPDYISFEQLHSGRSYTVEELLTYMFIRYDVFQETDTTVNISVEQEETSQKRGLDLLKALW